MIRVLFTDGANKACINALKSKNIDIVEQFYTLDQLVCEIKNFDAIVIRSVTKINKSIIDAALETGRLKLIVRAGVGTDNIDVKYAESHQIKVLNTPEASSCAVAELVLGHILCLSRFIYASNVTMRQGKWNKKNYEGTEIYGKTLGVIGFGRIGKLLANKANALGMNIIYTDIMGPCKEYPNYEYVSIDVLLQRSDFISLHVPFSEEYGCIIGAEQFSKMKPSAYIINSSRGNIVDEDALLDALDSGQLAGAALDVFVEEPTKNKRLYTHEKISITPHLGASTVEAQERIGKEISDIIINHL